MLVKLTPNGTLFESQFQPNFFVKILKREKEQFSDIAIVLLVIPRPEDESPLNKSERKTNGCNLCETLWAFKILTFWMGRR